MKKVLALVAAAAIFGSLAFAEKNMELGLKGGLLLNAGTKYAEDVGDTKMTLGGDIGIYGHFGLVDLGPGALSLQPEVFFSFANGLRIETDSDGDKFKNTVKYNSLDIALLIGYDIPVGKISIRPFFGPKVGIPIGKAKCETDADWNGAKDDKYDMKGASIGMDFGCGIAIPLGKFVLGADVRYGIDFNKVKAEGVDGEEMGKIRRGALGINVTAGYRF